MIDSNVIISIVGFVTTMAVTVLNQRASAREARRQAESKATELQLQVELANKLAEIKTYKMFREQSEERALQLTTQTADLTHRINMTSNSIKTDLQKNTDISIKAFEEANHVNNKITDLQNVLITNQKAIIDTSTDIKP